LQFFDNGWDGPISVIPVRYDGALHRLLMLCRSLSRKYGWAIPQAVSFVMADAMPIMDRVEWTVAIPPGFGCLSRIRLDIDPTLTPQEVAHIYGELRRRVMGKRPRKLSVKHMHLAVFATASLQDETWEQKMDRWNERQGEEQPDWHYEQVSNFARDCNQARDRLLNPSISLSPELYQNSFDSEEEE